jgi:hypothetical protein
MKLFMKPFMKRVHKPRPGPARACRRRRGPAALAANFCAQSACLCEKNGSSVGRGAHPYGLMLLRQRADEPRRDLHPPHKGLKGQRQRQQQRQQGEERNGEQKGSHDVVSEAEMVVHNLRSRERNSAGSAPSRPRGMRPRPRGGAGSPGGAPRGGRSHEVRELLRRARPEDRLRPKNKDQPRAALAPRQPRGRRRARRTLAGK